MTPEQVDMIVVDILGDKMDLEIQKKISMTIRKTEKKYMTQIEKAEKMLESVEEIWG